MYDDTFTRNYKTDEIPQSVYDIFRNHGCYLYCAERNGSILVYNFDEEDCEFTGRIDMVDSETSDVSAWANNYRYRLDNDFLVEEVPRFEDGDRELEAYVFDLKLTLETVRAIGTELEALVA